MTTPAWSWGKVILLGEHAVVYGAPALAVGIDRGAWATATPSSSAESSLEVVEWGASVSDGPSQDAPLARAFRAIVQATKGAPAQVTAGAELPPGGGLGCSAALGVAVARALDPRASPEVLAARAGAWEEVFHGNASGIDAAVAAAGGCLLFERGAGGQTIQRVRGRAPIWLCVGLSGVASSTKAMVEAVARHRERSKATVDKTFAAIGTLVRNARLALEAGDVVALGQLMDLNQMLLSGLFVSTPELEQLCATAREAGALGAKLTGAGGGGAAVALVRDAEHSEAVLEAWKREGFTGFATKVFDSATADLPSAATRDVLSEGG